MFYAPFAAGNTKFASAERMPGIEADNVKREKDMAIVSVQRADKYDADVLRGAIGSHFEALGIEQDLRPGLKVLLKPNLLAAHRPERAATTHPALIAAIIEWLRDRGVDDITIADSPGGIYKPGNLKALYEACGYQTLAGIAKLNFDTGYKAVPCPDGFVNRSFNIINPVFGADYIINVAKLKTHGLTTVTGGIKNLFGVIPGLQKPELHFKYQDIRDFCRMLLELTQLIQPQVTVIDAVDTMEGNGPLNGRVRHMGLTLASRDVYSQDYMAAYLCGISAETVPYLCLAVSLGLIDPGSINAVGHEAAPADPPYILPESVNKGGNRGFLLRSLGELVELLYRAVPSIDAGKCAGCGKCAESCPMKIIKIENRKAGMSIRHCISCFCCQEMCPFDAVRVRHVFRMPKL